MLLTSSHGVLESSRDPVAARDCEGAATPPNKDFIKTEKYQVFHSGATCYDV